MNRASALRLWLITAVRAAPWLTLTLFLGIVLSALAAPLSAQGVRAAVDALQHGGSALPGTVLIAAALAVGGVIGAFTAPAADTLDDRVQRHVHHRLIELTAGITTIAHHEDPALADRVALIRRDATELGRGVTRLLTTVRSLISVIAVGSLLWSIQPWLLILLPFSLLPAAVYGIGLQRRERIFREGERHRRLADKIFDILTSPAHALEIMCFDVAPQLDQAATTAYRTYSLPRSRVTRKYASYAAGTGLIFWAVYGLVIAWASSAAIAGRTTAGDVALLLVIAGQVAAIGLSMTNSATALTDGLEFFSRYAWLRNYAAQSSKNLGERQPPDNLTEGIRLDHVHFKYAPDGGDILHDLNLHMRAGSIVALVGANGAGKSTLVKLLTGMYQPTSGQILINSDNLHDLDVKAWREHTSAAFQDFVRFEFRIFESIGIGDLPRLTSHTAVTRAATEATADTTIDALALDYNTQLGTQYTNGVSLSGGQWQRLALARGFMRPTPLLMLLDEPAAALDADVEQQIYAAYVQRAKQAARAVGGIGIIVTHRLSSARLADQIIVLHNGTITEAGDHDDLIRQHGQYHRMFELQARSYR